MILDNCSYLNIRWFLFNNKTDLLSNAATKKEFIKLFRRVKLSPVATKKLVSQKKYRFMNHTYMNQI